MKQATITLATALALLLAGVLAGYIAPTAAQDDPPPVETIFDFALGDDDLFVAPAFVRLLRITMEPGANSPLHTHPGPELWRIEAGVVTLFVQGRANLQRAGEDAFEEAPDSTEFELNKGDIVAILPGTAMTFTNKGDDNVRLLASVILPAGNQHPPGITYVGDQPPQDAFAGISSDILGDGVAAILPAGDSIVRLERLRLARGQAIPAEPNPVLLTSAKGGLEFTLTAGAAQVSRIAEPGPQPDAAPGTEFTLESGDAVFFPYGMRETPRSEDDAEIQLYRLTILPGAEGATPVPADDEQVGVIEVTGPAAPEEEPTEEPEETPEPEATEEPDETAEPEATEEPEETPTEEAGRFDEGATVYVADVDVRMRSGPSTDAEIVTGLSFGQALVVTGPSEEGDDITWWPVQDTADPSIAGFVADQFLSEDPPE